MIKTTTIKCIALFLAFCILIPLAPIVNAAGMTEPDAIELPTLTAEDIPEYLSYEAALAAGHIQRVYSL